MRKTKIVCTLGPASGSRETLRELVAAGANLFRLNMSHAAHDWVRAVVPEIRAVAEELREPVGILLDTQGPAIRTGDLPGKLELKPGDLLELRLRGAPAREAYSTEVNYDGLVDDLQEGHKVLVDNGLIHLEVVEKQADRLLCRVLTAGTLGSRRHINLPGVKVQLPALTEKDRADIALGTEMGVDLVALSFCREAADVEMLRELLRAHGSQARVVAKIEDQLAVHNLREIVEKGDIVMVARGDLGIECAMEELPIIQRRIVKLCHRLGRPVIVATQLLESMISSPMPTRAEVTDVANAAFEQADAVMLSGETAVGRYPVECVKVLDRVTRRIERSGGAGYAAEAILRTDRERTMQAAVVLANSLERSALVVFTRRGLVANVISSRRPLRAPIFAFTDNEAVCRRIVLNWGTYPMLMPFDADPDATLRRAAEQLRERGFVTPGDKLVIVSDLLCREDLYDSIQVRPVL